MLFKEIRLFKDLKKRKYNLTSSKICTQAVSTPQTIHLYYDKLLYTYILHTIQNNQLENNIYKIYPFNIFLL